MQRMTCVAGLALAVILGGTDAQARVKGDPSLPVTPAVVTTDEAESAVQAAADSTRPQTQRKAQEARPLHALIERHASDAGIPVALAHAIVRVESNYNPKARGRAGEVGLMQIKPATARGMGYSGGAKGLYDPETNIRYGMKYLAGAHRLGGGDVCGTILRYNAGHGARRMNKVSAAYCAKVKRHMVGA